MSGYSSNGERARSLGSDEVLGRVGAVSPTPGVGDRGCGWLQVGDESAS